MKNSPVFLYRVSAKRTSSGKTSYYSLKVKRSCPSYGPELEGEEEKKGRGNPISVQLFPPELVEHIISFLPVRDVVALGQTCHYFHEVCDAESMWRRICRRLSPRLREQGSGVRSWKRAAILNCTPSPEPPVLFASVLPYSGIPPAP